MNEKYQHIIDQCEAAVKGMKELLQAEEYQRCLDMVCEHREWHLGLEFAIDAIVEEDIVISQEVFEEFQKAYALMNLEADTRIIDLKKQVG